MGAIMKPLPSSRANSEERGATAAEYALLISRIALVLFGSVTLLGSKTMGMFQSSCDKIAMATTSSSC